MSFTYQRVTALHVHDGDTFTAEIPTGQRHLSKRQIETDRGLHLYVRCDGVEVWRWPVRLRGCNAPELATPTGPAARDHLATLLTGRFTLATHLVQTERYGRVLGDITLPDGRDVVTVMVADGHAAAWDGHGVRPVPTP